MTFVKKYSILTKNRPFKKSINFQIKNKMITKEILVIAPNPESKLSIYSTMVGCNSLLSERKINIFIMIDIDKKSNNFKFAQTQKAEIVKYTKSLDLKLFNIVKERKNADFVLKIDRIRFKTIDRKYKSILRTKWHWTENVQMVHNAGLKIIESSKRNKLNPIVINNIVVNNGKKMERTKIKNHSQIFGLNSFLTDCAYTLFFKEVLRKNLN